MKLNIHFFAILSSLLVSTVSSASVVKGSGKIGCSDKTQNEVVIYFGDKDGTIVLTEKDGVLADNAPAVIVQDVSDDYTRGTIFSLELGEKGTFAMLVEGFSETSGTFNGVADYSVGSHNGASIKCYLDYLAK